MFLPLTIIKQNKGSYSIEASIVTFVVMVVIIILINISSIMYEEVRLNSILQNAVQRGALYYYLEDKDPLIGKPQGETYGDNFIYRRIIDFNKEEKLNTIKKNIMLYINKNKISSHKYTSEDIEVGMEDYFMYKKIYAVITADYTTIFNSKIKIKASAKAMVNDNVEFIRNIDFAADLLNESEHFSEIKEKYSEGIQKLKEAIEGGKINEK